MPYFCFVKSTKGNNSVQEGERFIDRKRNRGKSPSSNSPRQANHALNEKNEKN